jgi:pimeloyl-ACP methyl ester carboxylesterase
MSLTDRCSSEAAERGELALRLPLRHGGEAAATLRYELVGSGERLLLVAGGISAGRHVIASSAFPERGWWEAQARTFDIVRNRLLAIDWIGADGSLDLPIDPADQADAIAALLTHLGIARAAGFVGASYGGMVALHFAARHPSACGSILVISAAGSAHPFASACRSLQRRGKLRGIGEVARLELEQALGRERGEQPPAAAVAIVRGEQALAGREQRMEDGGDRAHAARGDERAGAAFEVGERLSEDVAGRIAAARILIARLLIEVREAEVRRQSDRRNDGAVCGVAVDSGADGAGRGGQGHGVGSSV